MAAHLARIHGTEEDKVNCPFYFKIGSCRHGDRCSRLHHKPAFSPTLLVQHLYRHPQRLAELHQAATASQNGGNNGIAMIMNPEQAQEDFFTFFEDLYMEFSKFGKLDALHVCDNLGDHMIGHVYIKYMDEEDAADALAVMNQRFYDGRQMQVEYSPVQNFQEARCRDYDEENCARGGFCNFMHVKPVPLALIRSLDEDASEERRRQRRVKSNDDDKPSHGTSSSLSGGHRKRSRRGDDDADSASHHSSSSSEASSVSRSKRRKKHHHHRRRSSNSSKRGNHKSSSSRRSRSGSNSS